METSLRYAEGSKTLKLHAKEKISLDPNIMLQAHAELDTYVGVPTHLVVMMRHFYHRHMASIDVGVHCNRKKPVGYNVRVKKEFLINSVENIRINLKGMCNIDRPNGIVESRNDGKRVAQKRKGRHKAIHREQEQAQEYEYKPKGAVELCWYKYKFQEDQNMRLKVGYELWNQVPYFQICENNWTVNFDMNGKWDVMPSTRRPEREKEHTHTHEISRGDQC